MTSSRNRIRMVLDRKIPDRIPIDMGGSFCTGISCIAYNRLKNSLGFSKRLARMYDFNQQLAYPEKEIIDLYNIDVIDAGQGFLKDDVFWRKWILNDGSKCLIPKYLNVRTEKDGTILIIGNEGLVLGKKPRTSLYVDQSFWVYKDLPSLPDYFQSSDLNKNIWAIPIPPFHLDITIKKDFEKFRDGISVLYNNTEKSIFLSVGCSIIEMGYFLRGFENFLCDIYTDERKVLSLLNTLTEKYLETLEITISAVGKYVDILFFGDDFAGEERMFISPEILKKIFVPFYKKMFEYVHNNSSCKVFFHSCGAIYDAIPLLIDAGIDILSPVQTSAFQMEAEKLKKEFGKDIIFWGGGVDTRRVLPHGTEIQVMEDVKRRLEIFGKDGGFVFNAIHNILADVPPQNIIAMLETVNKYGGY
jgi:uroporphyrinogen decarboxylase